uniref:Uncharacterized protein n=1 Tax=Romanomermis culicivorax TaxID=13658 RepID=A0A915JRM7_ROMCU
METIGTFRIQQKNYLADHYHRGFLCKDYVGSTTQKRNDSTENSNTRYIVIKLKNYDLSDLAHASKVCKQCYDAQVLSHLDVLNVPRTLLPVIVNVTAHVSRSSDGTKNVTWGNYSNLENFTNNDILWVYWHSNPSTFAMLAMSPSHDSNIRWAAIPQDGSYYNRRLHEASMYFFVVKNIVCQRPSRKSCHYWTTEGDRCVFHPKFGCHNFVDFMGQPPDDADNGTVCSKFKRMMPIGKLFLLRYAMEWYRIALRKLADFKMINLAKLRERQLQFPMFIL